MDTRGRHAPAGYRGRFAPSPTGPLHAGSLVAALGSWLDARAHGGRWLVRIEDIDRDRCRAGAAEEILGQLNACGLVADDPPVRQTARAADHDAALARLTRDGWTYPCGCSRAEIAAAQTAAGTLPPPGAESVYPGTCRSGLHGRTARAVRLRVTPALHAAMAGERDLSPAPLVLDWHDRRLGPGRQNVSAEVGDFVLRRADGYVSYQLAVAVDDAAQRITDVVRGDDLADNTPRQIHLQRLLGLPTPRYLHLPLVLGPDGAKLSKQHGAPPVDTTADPLTALRAAGRTLGLHHDASDAGSWLRGAVRRWLDATRRVDPTVGDDGRPVLA